MLKCFDTKQQKSHAKYSVISQTFENLFCAGRDPGDARSKQEGGNNTYGKSVFHPVEELFKTFKEENISKRFLKAWLGSSVGQRVVMWRSCRFYPWSGHIQESSNEHINKWNKK